MFNPLSDEQLIKRALAGSERAWLSLVKRYEKRLYNYALRMSGSPDDAMDILQDVLMSVYRNLESYRGDGSFVGWLFRIAAFRSTDFFRRKNFKLSQLEDQDALVDETSRTSPDVNLGNLQDNRDILLMMSTLSADQRQVVELKFFQNFTFDEIGSQLGISVNTAKTRLYAALGKMRESTPTQTYYAGDLP